MKARHFLPAFADQKNTKTQVVREVLFALTLILTLLLLAISI